MENDDCQTAWFKEDELTAVPFDPDDESVCFCGTACLGDEKGNAYCPACQERGKPTVQ